MRSSRRHVCHPCALRCMPASASAKLSDEVPAQATEFRTGPRNWACRCGSPGTPKCATARSIQRRPRPTSSTAHGTQASPTRPTDQDSGLPGRGGARPRAQSPSRNRLRRPLHLSGIHLAVPGDRPARFRHHGDRLPAAALPRSSRSRSSSISTASAIMLFSMRTARSHRQAAGRAAQAALAAHRRLFPPPRRHADRRVLAGRPPAAHVWVPDQGVRAYRGRE